MYPKYNGEVLKRAIDTYEHKFVSGDVCGYIIESPWEMTDNDVMNIKIYNIKSTEVYIAKGKNLRWFNHLDQMAEENGIYDTRAGWQFYVVGVASTIFTGTFTMKIWIERDAVEPTPVITTTEDKKVEDTKTDTTEQNT